MARKDPPTTKPQIPQKREFLWEWGVGLLFLVAALALSPDAKAQRTVFAHYMVTNQDYQADTDSTQEAKILAYQREIKEAQAAGIDGFALNVGGWFREPYYIRYSAQIFEAALRLHSNFKLMFSADMCCGNGPEDVKDMMRRFAGNPRYKDVYFQHEDKAVLTTFAGDKLGTGAWKGILNDLNTGRNPSTKPAGNTLSFVSGTPSNAPLPTFFMPAFFWGGELPQRAAIDAGLAQWSSLIDGAFYWGIAGVPNSNGALDQLPSSHAYAEALHSAHKLYMAPICPQFWGSNANRSYEYSGAEGLRAMWQSAIANHADWVEIITWNDFVEGSYVSPIDDPHRYKGANSIDGSGIPPGTTNYFHTHAGFTALLPYFIQWYKTGREPAIAQDSFYYFYRTQLPMEAAPKPPVAHPYGPLAPKLYITTNLTGDATLEITVGGKMTSLAITRGSHDWQVPLLVGEPPHIELRRKGKTVLASTGADTITDHPTYNNLYDSTGFAGELSAGK